MGLGFQASIQLFPWTQWAARLFAPFSNSLFVHDTIASRKQAKHVIVVKYLTLLEEALAGDNPANENVSTVSA